MSDNVNIIVQDTINDIVVNSAVTVETIDINVQVAVDEVTIIANPNEYVINVNRIIGEQVQSDWNETDDQAPDYIKNKPTIPAAQVNSDWDATSGVAEILNKPIIPAAVTKTSDLINDGEDGVNPFITLEDIPPVTGFVPYTGATQDVNLGEFGIQLGNLEFDTTPTNAPTGVGSLVWNDTAGTLDLKLKGNNVTLQIGQETVARVVNKTATNIPLLEANYQIVRVTGAQGQRPKVDLALANNDLNSTTTLGLVTENILNNQEGFITTSGQVQQINTTGSLQGETWADGDVLYLSGTVAGQATNIKPIAPIHTVIVGFVEYAHINQGKIFVKVDNGYELEELHNVSAIAPNNNEVLTYDSATLLWKPKTVFQLPSFTSGSVLFSDGTTIAQKNSNFFWDNTNNRLGIGTNAPTANLHINSAAQTELKLQSTVQAVKFTLDGLSYNNLVANNVVPFYFDFYSTLNFRGNASTTIMRLSTSTSNVLINTTTDNGGKLQIKAPGALSTDIALRVRNSADTANLLDFDGTGKLTVLNSNANGVAATFSTPNGGSVQFQNGYIESLAVQFRISTSGTQPFVLMTQGTERMRLAPTTGNVLIGTTTDIASAILNVTSTTRGFLPPRMTNAQRIAIATPAVGLMVYCTDTVEGVYVNKSTGWTFIG